jgi:hypothetical protein
VTGRKDSGATPLDPHERAARFAILASDAGGAARQVSGVGERTPGMPAASAAPGDSQSQERPDEDEPRRGVLGRLLAPKETDTETPREPLYPRLLRLRYVHPSGLQRALLVEGTAFVGLLWALADKATWWTPVVLPIAAAGVVKFHDVLTGVVGHRRPRAGSAPDGQDQRPDDPGDPGHL